MGDGEREGRGVGHHCSIYNVHWIRTYGLWGNVPIGMLFGSMMVLQFIIGYRLVRIMSCIVDAHIGQVKSFAGKVDSSGCLGYNPRS